MPTIRCRGVALPKFIGRSHPPGTAWRTGLQGGQAVATGLTLRNGLTDMPRENLWDGTSRSYRYPVHIAGISVYPIDALNEVLLKLHFLSGFLL